MTLANYVLLLIQIVAVSSLTVNNLALKKNAIQSSTLTNPDAVGLASNAVDGVADGEWTHGSCSHTNSDSPAWWAVDLGEEYLPVGRVTITNRNMGADRLSNFYIGLTNVSPWTSAPSLATSSICKFSADYPPAGVPTDFMCDVGTVSGRYLFVLLRDPGFLTICELEAYYACAPHCQLCDSRGPGHCDDSSCDSGYALDSSFTCSPTCAPHCHLCNSRGPGLCDDSSCDSPRWTIDLSFTCSPLAPTECTTILNCWFCYPDECMACKDPGTYFLRADGTGCEDCFDISEGTCATCNLTLTQCSKCIDADQRFVSNSNKYLCADCAPYCTSCNSRGGGLCDDGSCTYGYALDVVSYKCLPCADGCKICTVSGPGKCDICPAGQGLNNGQGTAPDDCRACFDAYCAYCLYNNAKCSSCKAGFFLDSASGQCAACSDPNCQQCFSGTAKCNSCRPGFRLNPNSGVCEACAPHCSNCNARGAGLCDAGYCDFGYAIDSNYMCKPSCPAGCMSCANNGPGMCDTCPAEKGLNNGEGTVPADCIVCADAYCAFCEDNNGICTQCKSGYHMDATFGPCIA